MQSLAGAIPARGLHLQKTQPPHAETMVCGGGYGLFLDAVAEGDFFFSPAGAAAGGVFDVSTVGVAAASGTVFRIWTAGEGFTAYLADVRYFF